MASRLALLLLLACLLAPAVASTRENHGAVGSLGLPFIPQMHCEILFDTGAASQHCSVTAALRDANELRINILGGGDVFAFMDDNVRSRQIALARCTGACIQPFTQTTTASAVMHVYANGNANAAMAITVVSGVGTIVG